MTDSFPGIGDLAFSTRVRNALDALGVRNLTQLAALTERDLLRSPNLGRKSLAEIHDLLARHGLVLGMVFAPEAPADPALPVVPRHRPAFDLRACLARRLRELEHLSAQGCASAANLGGAASQGYYGDVPDLRKARRYFVLAARGGSGLGAYNLALLHLQGLGVPTRRALARTWFRRSARLGCEAAQSVLATLAPAGIKRD